jgi:hypothetical protein
MTSFRKRPLIIACAIVSIASPLMAERVAITVKNLSKHDGLFLTPVWVGFHNGTFDPFNVGSPVMVGGGVERIAEDGDVTRIRTGFANSAAGMAGGVDDVILAPNGFAGAPVFDPGESVTFVIDLDPTLHPYFSFMSMLIPSNDAFIANDDPMGLELFDENGDFAGPIEFVVRGKDVLDAGTEANTEMDAAFFDQTAPNTGMTTADPVQKHPGFKGSRSNPDEPPMILGGTSTAPPGIFFHPKRADFSRPNYKLARIRIELADDDEEDDDDDDE